ncbi:hypothetical protein CAAU_2035 [Caloramator australicus RC3]|uniref:Uncharacterized protein n=1 Tax=Caloramator australicus RC3 TaxID=857293 RepID=I7KVP3_9CLOT|nr:hypothetical protein CAAU_2035 [Caloramator australicus RC3]
MLLSVKLSPPKVSIHSLNILILLYHKINIGKRYNIIYNHYGLYYKGD